MFHRAAKESARLFCSQCKKDLDLTRARQVAIRGAAFIYFCDRGCRQRFEDGVASPQHEAAEGVDVVLLSTDRGAGTRVENEVESRADKKKEAQVKVGEDGRDGRDKVTAFISSTFEFARVQDEKLHRLDKGLFSQNTLFILYGAFILAGMVGLLATYLQHDVKLRANLFVFIFLSLFAGFDFYIYKAFIPADITRFMPDWLPLFSKMLLTLAPALTFFVFFVVFFGSRHFTEAFSVAFSVFVSFASVRLFLALRFLCSNFMALVKKRGLSFRLPFSFDTFAHLNVACLLPENILLDPIPEVSGYGSLYSKIKDRDVLLMIYKMMCALPGVRAQVAAKNKAIQSQGVRTAILRYVDTLALADEFKLEEDLWGVSQCSELGVTAKRDAAREESSHRGTNPGGSDEAPQESALPMSFESLYFGSRIWLTERGFSIALGGTSAAALEEKGDTILFLAQNQRVLGYVALRFRVLPEVISSIKMMQNTHIEIMTMTGEYALTAQKLAEKLGIEHVRAELLCKDRVEAYSSVAQSGAVLLVVGTQRDVELYKEIPKNSCVVAYIGQLGDTFEKELLERIDIVSPSLSALTEVGAAAKRVKEKVAHILFWGLIPSILGFVPLALGILPVYFAPFLAISGGEIGWYLARQKEPKKTI